MIGGSLARRYARALLDIGKEEGQVRRVLSEAEEFGGVLEKDFELREVMQASHVSRQDKQASLEAVLSPAGFLPTTKSFLSLLIEKGRMDVLPQILSELRRMAEEFEGIERVEVTVPMPLSASQKDLLRAVLERRTGKKVVLEESVDPAVLGGMVVRVGSTVYDGSVRTQIHQIRENLQKG
ncbi:MAG TPA: ATP synthase F1 subunit delta [Candidatus Methylomirabilis sp.]|nr:ATP synthase F1 subunit delta [Candidatus Methylomirabilis sp.]